MKIAKGNDKLGKNCLIVSRPVGLTCPSSCFFLGNGCYAEFTEKRFPNARKAGFANLEPTVKEVVEVIQTCLDKGLSLRWHERGDWLTNDKPDMKYINAVKQATKQFEKLPVMWTYSHGYYKSIANLQNFGIQTYASVHNADDLRKAKRAGFKLFAWCSDIKRKKGQNDSVQKVYQIEGISFITCPEQRRSRDEVTCTGDKESIACNLCLQGKKNVLFLNH